MKIPGFAAIVLPMLVAALLNVETSAAARAEASHEYVIAANDGYGLEDCLAAGNECGRVVADAWCEAHSHGHALSYGLQSALEGLATRVSTTDDPYVIQCGD